MSASLPYSPMFARDNEHLRLLSIFHYIYGALVGLCGSFPLMHVAMGFAMLSGVLENPGMQGQAPPREMGWIFVGVGSAVVLLSWTMAACLIFSGISLGQRKRYMFCMVIAGISCLGIPLGTILGAFTIMVLVRDTVIQQFEAVRQQGTAG